MRGHRRGAWAVALLDPAATNKLTAPGTRTGNWRDTLVIARPAAGGEENGGMGHPAPTTTSEGSAAPAAHRPKPRRRRGMADSRRVVSLLRTLDATQRLGAAGPKNNRFDGI